MCTKQLKRTNIHVAWWPRPVGEGYAMRGATRGNGAHLLPQGQGEIRPKRGPDVMEPMEKGHRLAGQDEPYSVQVLDILEPIEGPRCAEEETGGENSRIPPVGPVAVELELDGRIPRQVAQRLEPSLVQAQSGRAGERDTQRGHGQQHVIREHNPLEESPGNVQMRLAGREHLDDHIVEHEHG